MVIINCNWSVCDVEHLSDIRTDVVWIELRGAVYVCVSEVVCLCVLRVF